MEESLCDQVLVVGTDKNGKGGIATVINMQSSRMRPFHYICSHRFDSRYKQLWLTCVAYVKFLCAVSKKNIKIVHIHTASYRSFYIAAFFVLVGKLFGKAVILQLHGGEFFEFARHHARSVYFICNKVDVLLGVSKFVEKKLQDMHLKGEVQLLYNPIVLPTEDKVVIHQNKANVSITFMGSIDDNKGIFKVLEVLADNKSYYASVCNVNIAGIGDTDRLCALIQQYGIGSFVKYIGWVDAVAKDHLLTMTDIYIQPSCYESLGIAIIEAMSYGIPVVATRVGGIPELIDSGVNGYLFDYNEFNQIDTFLKLLINDYRLRAELGRNARSKSEMFSVVDFEERLKTIYQQILS